MHSPDLIRQHGAIGFWMQQGVEAAHKRVKKAIRSSSNYGGGRQCDEAMKPSTAILFQVFHKEIRSWVSATRRSLTVAPPPERTQYLKEMIRNEIGLSASEGEFVVDTQRRTSNRVFEMLKVMVHDTQEPDFFEQLERILVAKATDQALGSFEEEEEEEKVASVLA